jgi:preprotein translocase subunit YajC
MTDQQPSKTIAADSGFIAASGSQVDFFGTFYLFLLALLLLFALLRAQRRNRQLMRELMKAVVGAGA